jgi:predicted DCC family thiol-disulfide oxidoreductase YuxK
MSEEKSSILLYDGDCSLCNLLVSAVKDSNDEIQCIAQQSNKGQTILMQNGLSGFAGLSVVYLRNHQYYLKSSASLLLLKDMRGWRKFFYVFILLPKPIRDFVYDMVAKNRHRFFGKQKNCKLKLSKLNMEV